MSYPTPARFDLTPDLSTCRILNGMWQVSGAHGPVNQEAALGAMFQYHDSGFTTWDLADHYGPAEDFIGEFRRRMQTTRGEVALGAIQAFTKWVPQPGRVTRRLVEKAIKRSVGRMAVPAIDLLQFHWWEYADSNYLDALSHLADLREEGVIRHLALTNFDTERLQLIVDRGIPIVSNQVQYSLVDRRPEVEMATFCRQRNIHLLTYGTVCGGLLSERYLGRSEPRGSELNTASLQKYKRMIDLWGGWPLFQQLLQTLKNISDRRGMSIANVGVRYILDQPAVAGVIVGVRLGVAEHYLENVRVFNSRLEPSDVAEIGAVVARGRDLFQSIGDCGDEYRH